MKSKNLYILVLYFVQALIIGQEKFIFYFEIDAEEPQSESVLLFQKWLKTQTDLSVYELKAYCDSTHSEQYNNQLAIMRNKSIQNILQINKVPLSNALQTKAIGENFKADSLLHLNRKVEVYFHKKQNIKPNATNRNQFSNETLLKVQQEEVAIETAVFEYKPMDLETFYLQLENAKDGERIQIFDIHFYLDSPKMILKSEPYLNKIMEYLQKYPDVSIRIEGHMCCNLMGNIKLSEKRAKNIYKYLLMKGIKRKRLEFEGMGVQYPIYEIPEKNEEERLKNRRVEIVVNKKE
jgi:outer membrane protein OmpA-like peptidoglycan-associated protein